MRHYFAELQPFAQFKGYVNLQEALASIPDGKKVQENLRNSEEETEALAKERDDIQKKGEELQKQPNAPEAFRRQRRKLAAWQFLQESVMASNQELALKEKELAAQS